MSYIRVPSVSILDITKDIESSELTPSPNSEYFALEADLLLSWMEGCECLDNIRLVCFRNIWFCLNHSPSVVSVTLRLIHHTWLGAWYAASPRTWFIALVGLDYYALICRLQRSCYQLPAIRGKLLLVTRPRILRTPCLVSFCFLVCVACFYSVTILSLTWRP